MLHEQYDNHEPQTQLGVFAAGKATVQNEMKAAANFSGKCRTIRTTRVARKYIMCPPAHVCTFAV